MAEPEEHIEREMAVNRPSSRKLIIAALVAAAVLLIAFVLWFFITQMPASFAFTAMPVTHPVTGDISYEYENAAPNRFMVQAAVEKYTLVSTPDKASYHVTVTLYYERMADFRYKGDLGQATIPIYKAVTRYEMTERRSGITVVLEKEDNPHISLQTGIFVGKNLPEHLIGGLTPLWEKDIEHLLTELNGKSK